MHNLVQSHEMGFGPVQLSEDIELESISKSDASPSECTNPYLEMLLERYFPSDDEDIGCEADGEYDDNSFSSYRNDDLHRHTNPFSKRSSPSPRKRSSPLRSKRKEKKLLSRSYFSNDENECEVTVEDDMSKYKYPQHDINRAQWFQEAHRQYVIEEVKRQSGNIKNTKLLPESRESIPKFSPLAMKSISDQELVLLSKDPSEIADVGISPITPTRENGKDFVVRVHSDSFDWKDDLESENEDNLELLYRARKIQHDLRLQEMKELAEEAERAAEEGKEKFIGNATKFGLNDSLSVILETTSPYKGPLLKEDGRQRVESEEGNMKNITTPLRSVIDQRYSSQIHITPKSDIKRPRPIIMQHRLSSEPSKLQNLNYSPSILTAKSILSLAQTSIVEKVPVLSLRHIEEVFPSFGEMHPFIRSHMVRSGVDEKMLNFRDDISDDSSNEKIDTINEKNSAASTTSFFPKMENLQTLLKTFSGVSFNNGSDDSNSDSESTISHTETESLPDTNPKDEHGKQISLDDHVVEDCKGDESELSKEELNTENDFRSTLKTRLFPSEKNDETESSGAFSQSSKGARRQNGSVGASLIEGKQEEMKQIPRYQDSAVSPRPPLHPYGVKIANTLLQNIRIQNESEGTEIVSKVQKHSQKLQVEDDGNQQNIAEYRISSSESDPQIDNLQNDNQIDLNRKDSDNPTTKQENSHLSIPSFHLVRESSILCGDIPMSTNDINHNEGEESSEHHQTNSLLHLIKNVKVPLLGRKDLNQSGKLYAKESYQDETAFVGNYFYVNVGDCHVHDQVDSPYATTYSKRFCSRATCAESGCEVFGASSPFVSQTFDFFTQKSSWSKEIGPLLNEPRIYDEETWLKKAFSECAGRQNYQRREVVVIGNRRFRAPLLAIQKGGFFSTRDDKSYQSGDMERDCDYKSKSDYIDLSQEVPADYEYQEHMEIVNGNKSLLSFSDQSDCESVFVNNDN